MLTIKLNNTEYPLATNLMVAYKLQGCNNHTPYTQIFQDIGDMTLEKQLEVLYVAFTVANPKESSDGYTKEVFTTLLLNDPEFNVSSMMTLIKGIMEGVLGKKFKDVTGATGAEGNE